MIARSRPDLSGLFSGESLAVLVDLHSITFYTDSSGVANASVARFRTRIVAMAKVVKVTDEVVKLTTHLAKTAENAHKW